MQSLAQPPTPQGADAVAADQTRAIRRETQKRAFADSVSPLWLNSIHSEGEMNPAMQVTLHTTL
jgi:hypothetical protein